MGRKVRGRSTALFQRLCHGLWQAARCVDVDGSVSVSLSSHILVSTCAHIPQNSASKGTTRALRASPKRLRKKASLSIARPCPVAVVARLQAGACRAMAAQRRLVRRGMPNCSIMMMVHFRRHLLIASSLGAPLYTMTSGWGCQKGQTPQSSQFICMRCVGQKR